MRPHSLRPLLPLLPLSLFLGIHANGSTQTLQPDAGSIRQQIEQQRPLPALPAPAPERVTLPPEIKPQPGLSVTVNSFRFAGNKLLPSEQLAQAVSSFLNRPLGFAELQAATDAIAKAFREQGWLVRVYLPEQDISAGIVTLQVIEARFAGARLEGSAPSRVMSTEIEGYFRDKPARGQPLSVTSLDRALLLADDLPGVSVAGTLMPGEAEGETALMLQATDEQLVYGDLSLDNMGSRSTGSDRLMANLNINSPGQRGELVSLNLLHTQGSDYTRVAMTVPDGYNGLRLGLSLSTLSFRVVEGSTKAAQLKGRTHSQGLDLSYPLVRARLHNLYLTSGLETKSFFTQDSSGVKSDYASDALRVGLSGNRFDSLGGGGANSASVQLLWGHLTSMQTHGQLDTIGRASHKLNYSLSRQQSVAPSHSALLSLTGQFATQTLDSSEKFYIGGAQSVRAYPSGELGGERGQVLAGEWRWRFNPAWVATAFADVGRVVSLAQTSSDQDTTSKLRGMGLSLSWQGSSGVLTKLVVARRGARNPRATPTGTDGDGSLKLNRVWLSASLPF